MAKTLQQILSSEIVQKAIEKYRLKCKSSFGGLFIKIGDWDNIAHYRRVTDEDIKPDVIIEGK